MISLISEQKSSMESSLLFLRREDCAPRSGYCEKMLLHNNIPGILPFSVRQMNEEISCCFDTTGTERLAVRFEKNKLSFRDIQSILLGIIRAINRSKEYLLEENDFVLLPEYIFTDNKGESIFLCYLPGYEVTLKEQLAVFFEFLMNKLDYNDKRAVIAVYSLYTKSKEDECTFDQMQQLMMESEHDSSPTKPPLPSPRRISPIPVHSYCPVEEPAKQNKFSLRKLFRPEKTSQISMIADTGRTVLLHEAPAPATYILQADDSTEESIYLLTFPFYIGKEGSNANHCIADSTISRLHAKITIFEGMCSIEDMNSTNGTKVNNLRLTKNESHPLNPGDEVQLANRSYHFLQTLY